MSLGIAFLCSGGGGNLRLLHALIERGVLPGCSLSAVIADRDCAALAWARGCGLPAREVAYTRERPDELGAVLGAVAPDLVVTTFHKILDDDLVARFAGRLVNLHYSLLPAFGGAIGMTPVRMALAQGCRVVGASAHQVTPVLDGGPILAQACTPADTGVPEPALFDAVFRCGAVALASAVEAWVAPREHRPGGTLSAGGTEVLAGPKPRPAICEVFADPRFWTSLQ